jgi:hypothetical protein
MSISYDTANGKITWTGTSTYYDVYIDGSFMGDSNKQTSTDYSYSTPGTYSVMIYGYVDGEAGSYNQIETINGSITIGSQGSGSAPAAPTALVVSEVSTTGARIAWTGNDDAYSYEVYVSTSSIFSSLEVNETGIGNQFYNASGLSAGTTYYVRVFATNPSGTSNALEGSFTTSYAPVEYIFTSDITTSTATIQWDNNANGEVTHYKIEIASNSNFTSAILGEVARGTDTYNRYDATGLAASTQYYVRIMSIKKSGATIVNSSDWAYLAGGFVTAAPSAPGVPESLAVVDIAPNTAKITWAAPSDLGVPALTGYSIQIAAISSFIDLATPIAINNANANEYTFSGLIANTAYVVRICAVNSAGNGEFAEFTFSTTATYIYKNSSSLYADLGYNGVALNVVVNPLAQSVAWSEQHYSNDLGGYVIIQSDNGGLNPSLQQPSYQLRDRITGQELVGEQINYYQHDLLQTRTITGLVAGQTRYVYLMRLQSNGTGINYLRLAFTPSGVSPSAPSIVALSPGSNNATLSWVAPASVGQPAYSAYRLQIAPAASSFASGTTVTAASSSTSYEFTGLNTGTAYKARIRAESTRAVSSAPEATVTTSYAAPSAPQGLSVSSVTSGGATINWTAPSNTGGQPILRYKVQVIRNADADDSSPVFSNTNVSSSATSLAVTGLSVNTVYRYTVSASNSVGEGAVAAGGSTFTTLKIAPGAPVNVGISGEATTTSAILRWGAPTTGTTPFVYTIVVSANSDLSSPIINDSAYDGLSQTLTNLSEGTVYYYSVTASNGAAGAPSVTGSFSTRADGPGVPQNLSVIPGDGQITLSWEAPATSSLYADTYVVYNGAGAPISGLTIAQVGWSTFSAVHSGLVNGTVYSYRVAARRTLVAPQNPDAPGVESEKTLAVPVIPISAADPVADLIAAGQSAQTQEGAVNIMDAMEASTGNLPPEQQAQAYNQTIGAIFGTLPPEDAVGAVTDKLPNSANPTPIVDASTQALLDQDTSPSTTAGYVLDMTGGMTDSNQRQQAVNSGFALIVDNVATNAPSATDQRTALKELGTGLLTGVEADELSLAANGFTQAVTGTLSPPAASATLLRTAYTAGQTDSAAQQAVLNALNNTLAGTSVSLDQSLANEVFGSIPSTNKVEGTSFTNMTVKIPDAETNTVPLVNTPGTVVGVPAASGQIINLSLGGVTRSVQSFPAASPPYLLVDGVQQVGLNGKIVFGSESFTVVAIKSVYILPDGSTVQINNVPCFPAGVMIRTPEGEKAVETLKTGDKVVTAAGRVVPIRMHSYSLAATTKATAPYFIPAHALGPNAPAKPLHLSPLHAFQVRPNVWWCAQQAAKVSSKIQQYAVGEAITYYHVECPNFLRDNLVADGVVVESFAGKQLTATESRNLYKFNKAVGGYVRVNPVKSKSE